MSKSANILEAIKDRDFARFLQVLDEGAKAACLEAAHRSRELEPLVVDGRARETLKRKSTKLIILHSGK